MSKRLISLLLIVTSTTLLAVNERDNDPMRPELLQSNVPASSNPGEIVEEINYTLQSIQYDQQGYHCMINQQRLRIGDKIGRAEVVDISRNQVTLRRDTIKIELQMHTKRLKTPHSPAP
ncbi:MAG: hypothetical protein HQL49_12030 [Gammaproteobacteria bacterium]|nr:hypothetical protein [Gammaproteobacteria bacterium]